jgi:hypothetical protein
MVVLACNAPPRRVGRPKRLFNEILVAFHRACDQRDNEIALELLRVLDFMAMREPSLSSGEGRRINQGLVAAHERLWEMRHPPEDGGEAGVLLWRG